MPKVPKIKNAQKFFALVTLVHFRHLGFDDEGRDPEGEIR
jgi:hypothetical protein